MGTTEVVPDFSTVWLFRERLIKSGRFEDLWRELQRQIDEKGYTVKEGSIQDATSITSDPGRKRKKKAQEAECKKVDQDLKAIEPNLAHDIDKDLLDISINIINSQENQRDLMKSQRMKEAGQKRV